MYLITWAIIDDYAQPTAPRRIHPHGPLEPNGIVGSQLAAKLGVSPFTLNRVYQGTSGISPEMALRLSKSPRRSPERWLSMQDNHDLWQARQTEDLDAVERIDFRAA